MKLIVTIQEETFEAALQAIGELNQPHDQSHDQPHDGIELRAEHLAAVDLGALRAATPGMLILTHRGRRVDESIVRAAIAAGVDLVDVEWHEALDRDLVHRYADRIILSHHDYDGMPDVERILESMRSFGAVQTKLAVTPQSFEDNRRLLEALHGQSGGVTMIGMGARGLYSRILTPFFGSELQFVAVSEDRGAAPRELTLS